MFFLLLGMFVCIGAVFYDRQEERVFGADDTTRFTINSGEEPEYYLTAAVITQSSQEAPVVTVSSSGTGAAELTVDLYSLTPDDVLNYLTYTGTYQLINVPPNFSNYSQIGTLSASLEKNVRTNYEDQYYAVLELPVSDNGIWLVHAYTPGKAQEQIALLVRSNVGVATFEAEDELIFWGQYHDTKQRINAGRVTAYNLEGGITELQDDGFALDGSAQLTLSTDVDVVLAEVGDDTIFLPVNMSYVNYDYSYQRFSAQPERLTTFLFVDRPLYTQGETVYFKAIMRDDNDASYSLPTGEVSAKIYTGNSEETPIYEQTLQISADGTVYSEAIIPEDAPSDYYYLSLTLPEQYSEVRGMWEYYNYSPQIGFYVDYFRKPDFFVKVDSEETEIIHGDDLEFTVSGQFFSGHPIINRPVSYKIIAEDYYDYTYKPTERNLFDVEDKYKQFYAYRPIPITTGTTNFNEYGEAKVRLNTQDFPNRSTNHVYIIEFTYTDESANPNRGFVNVLVYPGEFSIYREQEPYKDYRVNEEVQLPVVLVPNNGANTNNIKLDASISREYYEKKVVPEKKYPEFIEKSDHLTDVSVVTDADGRATLTFTPTAGGSHAVKVTGTDVHGNVVAKTFYVYVQEQGRIYYNEYHRGLLTVQVDKEEYQPTDKVNVTVSSELPDVDVILTFGRGYMHRYEVVHVTGNSQTYAFDLFPTDFPNIRVNAFMFSASDLDRDGANIVIDPAEKTLSIKIESDKEKYAPGDSATFTLTTADKTGKPVSANLAFWAIDKALLELVSPETRQIFDKFWYDRGDGMSVAHSLEEIYSQPRDGAGGGCFTYDTPVLIADGSSKAIGEITVGESVLTRKGEFSAELVPAVVTGVHKVTVGGYFVLNNNLEVTPEHRLWVNNKWQTVDKIKIGDKLIDSTGAVVEISAIEWRAENVDVYNLEIEKYQTYFAGNVWVHNQKGGITRSVFENTAYWNPNVTTDANGIASLTFTMPDNLTTWVVSAVGSTADTLVGQASTEVIVSKDVVVRPIIPNIIRQGDKIVLSMLVHNHTDEDINFDVSLTYGQQKILPRGKFTSTVKNSDRQQYYFDFEAEAVDEQAQFTFSAVSKTDTTVGDEVQIGIPILPFEFTETEGQAGVGPVTYDVNLEEYVDLQKSIATVSISPTIAGSLFSAMNYLVGYPYGCTEQLTSNIVPGVVAQEHPELFSAVLADHDVTTLLTDGVKKLEKEQRYDGLWAWWDSKNEGDLFVTAYVVDTLSRAKALGMPVNDDTLGSVRTVMESKLRQGSLTPKETILATYILSVIGTDTTLQQLTDFTRQTPDIVSLGVMANLNNGYTDPNTNGLNFLVSSKKTELDTYYWEAGSVDHFGSIDASTAMAIKAMVQGGIQREEIVKAVSFLMQEREQDYWSNTFATAKVVDALADFITTGNEDSPNYAFTVLVDGNQVYAGEFTAVTDNMVEVAVPLTEQDTKIELTMTGEGQMYSTLVIDKTVTDRKAQARNGGLSISKTYVNTKGPQYELGVGDTVNVSIIVEGLKGAKYLVIEDSLPAGMIPINYEFYNESISEAARVRMSNYNQVTGSEMTQNGIIMSVMQTAGESKVFVYKARVVNEGEFIAPPATVSLMYSPEISGRSEVQTVNIVAKTKVPVSENVKAFFAGFDQRTALVVGIILGALISAGIYVYKIVMKRKRKPTKSDTEIDSETHSEPANVEGNTTPTTRP